MLGRRHTAATSNHHAPRSARVRMTAAVLGACAVLAPVALRAQGPYTSFTVFGDSYSDTGNLFQLTGGTQPAFPPYVNGRFSNGPIWVDDLTAQLGIARDAAPAFVTRAASGDYAIGGARTNSTVPPGTDAQVASYLTRPGTTPSTLTDPTGLYAILAGGNDLRDIGALTDATARQAAAAAAAQRVVAEAGLLAGSGARNLLLFTLPSLSSTPEAQAIPGRPAIDDAIAVTFNTTLAAGLAGLHASLPGTTFFDFRFDNLYTNILADARAGGAQYGLTNYTLPCFTPGAPSCDVSVFSDPIHPTARTHQLIANAVYTYVTTGVNVAVAPEPATVVLMAGGLMVLGGLTARRRRVA